MQGSITYRNPAFPLRSEALRVVFTGADAPVTGAGTLTVEWTDAVGRLVLTKTEMASAKDGSVSFDLPTDRALTAYNKLFVRFAQTKYTTEAEAEFFIVLPARRLDDFTVVMYYAYEPHRQAALRQYHIFNGKASPQRDGESDLAEIPKSRTMPWYKAGFGYYVDQTMVPFLATYHSPMYKRGKSSLTHDTIKLYLQDRTSKEAFIRHPSLHDLGEADYHLDRLEDYVKSQRHMRPLFYSTDETSVTELVQPWDFDFDPRALADFREWLRGIYGTLARLNAEWETEFADWQSVLPFTTDEIIARGGDNLAPWADHRRFMNLVFAKAVKQTTDAVHAADPGALAGIVGAQMPSTFGGYDYWLLSKAMDVIEPYNIGNNRELWRSFAPEKPVFMTGFSSSPHEVWRHWHQALHGDSGVIIYDEKARFLDEHCGITDYGRPFVPLYRELTTGLSALLAQAKPADAPVAIHYSHASITASWMLERPSQDTPWLDENADVWKMHNERQQSLIARLRESAVKLNEDSWLPYDFLSYEQLEDGTLETRAPKLLILPGSVAMSQAEADAVIRFVENGGTVLADNLPAVMDEHARALPFGQLDALFGVERAGIRKKPSAGVLTRCADIPVWAQPLAASAVLHLSAAEDLTVTDGTALYADENGRPAVVVRTFGKGQTVYMNADLTDYYLRRITPPQGDELLAWYRALCGVAGISAPMQITMADGTPAPGVENFTYDLGTYRVHAFLHNRQLRIHELGPAEAQEQAAFSGDWPLSVVLPESGRLYNVRTGECLGCGDTFTAVLPDWEPLIVSVLPEAPSALELTAGGTAPGEWLEASVRLADVPRGGRHVVNLRLDGPEGAILPDDQINLRLTDGAGTWSYPMPFNQAPGAYTLVARDAATGLTARYEFVI